jgi:acetaldehyde dehydrogenase (acetylating)
MGLVRAAYSAGKPAYGVGPGNAPAFIERSADVPKAVRDVVTGKTFDNGVLCSSENSVVVDGPVVDEVKREFVRNGGYFMSQAEIDAVAGVLLGPQRLPNPKLVGRSATVIAQAAGITVPAETRVLIAELTGVGRDFPLSIEKLSPVLSFYVVEDWKAGCERCIEILRYGGMGHTMSIHSRNDQIILEFGLKKPAGRIVVNTPTTHGSIGLTTGLDPAMTLGCGGWGGNITSDNISPRHLLNIKRLAYETTPAVVRTPAAAAARDAVSPANALPRPPAPVSVPGGISADVLARRIDEFLTSRGYRPAPSQIAQPAAAEPSRQVSGGTEGGGRQREPERLENIADFVCEDDVRQAIKQNRKIVIGERSIVTPAARDLGDQHRLFVQASWPR